LENKYEKNKRGFIIEELIWNIPIKKVTKLNPGNNK